MNRFLLFAIIIASVPLLMSCRQKETYRIGVSQCSQDDWRNKMNDEIYREVMFHPEASVEIRSANDNNEKQIADIRYFKDAGFDIIIAAPNEADAITPVIKEVYESGTPVIVFDRSIIGDTYTAYIGVDNYGLGKAAAHYARHLLGKGGKVLEIYGLQGSTPAIGRHKGFTDGALCEGLELANTVYGNWNYKDATLAVDSILASRDCSDIDLIYAHNDRMAIAASEVARRHKLDVKVIGIDAAPEIGIKAVADSVIDATFLYPTEGDRLVRTALAILKGEPYEREIQIPLSSPVDLSNADIILLQNEALKQETDRIKVLKGQVDEFWIQHSAQTSLFYAVIAILVLLIGVLFLVLRAYWQHRRHQQQLMAQNRLLEEQRDTQKALNEQLEAATQSKLMFFTNVSHDLRTPLTLIAEPVEQLAQAGNLSAQQEVMVKIANKNVKILRRLLNQILDFRKYENGKLTTALSEVKLGHAITEWAEAFRPAARRRDIRLTTDICLDSDFSMAVDIEKIERVFFNLVSNAIKYTPDNGKVTITVSATDTELKLSVSDTGYGISAEAINNIFDRFYQVDKVRPQGSGIGLSLAKAFVELHGGTISVESTLGTGSTFTVTLPVTHTDEAPQIAAPANTTNERTCEEINDELEAADSDDSDPATDSHPLMLVIDDNHDIRLLLSQLLADDYRILCAPDGKEGLRLAARYVPDLIVCDVMMPEMDGLECCRKIKNEVSTSHIPVLLLTACTLDEQRAEGYDSGADGYLAKPFNATVLKARCRSLIENRKRITDILAEKAATAKDGVSEEIRPDVENEFYARFIEIVQSDMGDPELNIDAIASKMGLGRSQLYRKIKSLTNYTPVELLRNLRLKRSRELLVKTRKSISEVGYEVGFSTPAYFTRCFKEAYGETPSELRDRLNL